MNEVSLATRMVLSSALAGLVGCGSLVGIERYPLVDASEANVDDSGRDGTTAEDTTATGDTSMGARDSDGSSGTASDARSDADGAGPGIDSAGGSDAGATVVQIAAHSSLHVCALKSDHTTYCWGDDSYGQVTGTPGPPLRTPTLVRKPDGTPLLATELLLGDNTSCAKTTGGTLACWGGKITAELGRGDLPLDGTQHRVGNVNTVTESAQVAPILPSGIGALGGAFGCALASADSASGLYCWGNNGSLTMDESSSVDWLRAGLSSRSSQLTAATQLVSGAEFSCASFGDRIMCWGRSRFCELGVCFGAGDGGPDHAEAKLQRVQDLAGHDLTGTVSAIAAGGEHTCALVAGEIYCWGSNDQGQLGRSNLGAQAGTAGLVSALLANRSGIAAGSAHSCAIAGPNSNVQCWGGNSWGCAGKANNDGDPWAPSPPIKSLATVELTAVRQLALGAAFSCALTAKGAVYCWGFPIGTTPPSSEVREPLATLISL